MCFGLGCRVWGEGVHVGEARYCYSYFIKTFKHTSKPFSTLLVSYIKHTSYDRLNIFELNLIIFEYKVTIVYDCLKHRTSL